MELWHKLAAAGLALPTGARRKTKALAEQIAKDGATPLEIMLACMRHAFHAGRTELAVDFARKAAPYVHPRLQSIELDISGMSDEDVRGAAR